MWCLGGTVPTTRRSSMSNPPLRPLFALDALEEGAEVAGAKPAVPLALDELVEKGSGALFPVKAGCVLHEDLEQVAVLLGTVDEDAQSAQVVRVLVDAADVEH